MRLAYQIFAIIFCVSDASLGGARPFVAKAPVAHLRNSFPQLPAEIKPLSLVVLSPSTEHSSDWLRDTNVTIAWMVIGGAPNDGPRTVSHPYPPQREAGHRAHWPLLQTLRSS